MSLKEYNYVQTKIIKEFIKIFGGNPEDETNEVTIRLELEWVEKGYSDMFRKTWLKYEFVSNEKIKEARIKTIFNSKTG